MAPRLPLEDISTNTSTLRPRKRKLEGAVENQSLEDKTENYEASKHSSSPEDELLRLSDEVLADAGEWEDETFEDIEENETVVNETNEWYFPTEPETWWDRQGVRLASDAERSLFRQRLSKVMICMLELCKSTQPGKQLFRDIAFNLRIWAFTVRLGLDYALTILESAILENTVSVLGKQHVSINDLLLNLPGIRADKKYNRYRDLRGVYAIFGSHDDGRTAIYVGASKKLYTRMQTHARCLLTRRRGIITTRNKPSVYRILAQPGWRVSYRILAEFNPKHHFLFSYLLESAFMILLGSISHQIVEKTNHIQGGLHTTTMVNMIKEAQSNGFQFTSPGLNTLQEILPLNKRLPLAQSCPGRDTRPKVCRCGANETTCCQWDLGRTSLTPYDENNYQCHACCEYFRFYGRERPIFLEERRENRILHYQIAPDICGVCRTPTPHKGIWKINFEDPGNSKLCQPCYSKRWSAAAKEKYNADDEVQCAHCGTNKAARWSHDPSDNKRMLCAPCYTKTAAKGKECIDCKITDAPEYMGVKGKPGKFLCRKCYKAQGVAKFHRENPDIICPSCLKKKPGKWSKHPKTKAWMCIACYQSVMKREKLKRGGRRARRA